MVADQSPSPRLPDPTAMCGSVVRAAVEVLRGERPATHLARWVTPQVLDQLVHRARLVQPGRGTGRTGVPVTVRRIRTVRLGDGTAEATVVLEDAGRVRAAAVRLEARRGVWRVAVLELG
nr:Rv3235 family protein [Isoptericola halotolerans]